MDCYLTLEMHKLDIYLVQIIFEKNLNFQEALWSKCVDCAHDDE